MALDTPPPLLKEELENILKNKIFKIKIIIEIVAINFISSRPLARQPIGMLTVRAKNNIHGEIIALDWGLKAQSPF